jgi:hypothetical protein
MKKSMFNGGLCTTCVVWHLNRDESALDPRDEKPMAHWDDDPTVGEYTVTLILDPHFSTTPCDGCGSEAASDRFDAVFCFEDLRPIVVTIGALS